MKLTGADVLPYRLPFRTPLPLVRGTLNERVGFLLRIRAGGVTGYGEASPVWWSGEESLDAVWRDLRSFVTGLNHGDVCADRLRRALGGDVSSASDCERELARQARFGARAALCAIDTALLDLKARQCSCTCAALLGATALATVECNALVVEPEPGVAAAAASVFLEKGFRSIKLKVGVQPLARDLERVAAVCDACGGKARLRLDANRAWDVATARKALDAIARFEVEYVEEPLASPSPEALCRLRKETSVAIALDESITSAEDVVCYASAEAGDVVILKLVRLGGPSRVIEAATTAVAAGLPVVCTDSIETAVGRAAAVQTAAVLPGRQAAVGLGGCFLLAHDVTESAIIPQPRAEVRGPGLGPIDLRRDME